MCKYRIFKLFLIDVKFYMKKAGLISGLVIIEILCVSDLKKCLEVK